VLALRCVGYPDAQAAQEATAAFVGYERCPTTAGADQKRTAARSTGLGSARGAQWWCVGRKQYRGKIRSAMGGWFVTVSVHALF
jgi:hypothetical protein